MRQREARIYEGRTGQGHGERSERSRWASAIGAVALVAFAAKVAIALTTLGTNDVVRWEEFLDTLYRFGGIGLYYSVGAYNHPPFIIHALYLMGFMERATGVPFPYWLRVPGICADLGSLLLVWKLQPVWRAPADSPLPLLLMAAAPASIMISGFHGNTDPLMIFFVLLSVYLLEGKGRIWLAGAALGMSVNVKVVPLIFVPTMYWYLPSTRARLAFFGSAAAVFLLGGLPYILQDPLFIAFRILGYGSDYGRWGVPRLLTLLAVDMPRFAWLNAAYAALGRLVALGSIVAAPWWLNRASRKPSLYLQCGLVVFLFMALTPGFGVQYLAWLVPWVVALGAWPCLIFYLTSGVFLFLVYTFWAGGFPWYFASVWQMGVWRGDIIPFELLCWASVALMVGLYLKRLAPDALASHRGVTPLSYEL